MLRMSKTPRNLTIFEGPDGSGKTTLAKKYASETGALYIHFEAHEHVSDIHKFFIEAMQPALLGYQDVVFDRCWHSGPIYDAFYRNLEPHEQRMSREVLTLLDRAAAHCNAVIVHCRPSENTCLKNWSERVMDELVKTRYTMQGIYQAYDALGDQTDLPVISWNYELDSTNSKITSSVAKERSYSYDRDYETKVHIIVSSDAKTSSDMLIDIPGVEFDKKSNEYRLATEFINSTDREASNVTTESLVKFLPADANLFEYFAQSRFNTTTQFLIGIGGAASVAVDTFCQGMHFGGDAGLVRNIQCYTFHNIAADTKVRDMLDLNSIDTVVRDAHIRIGMDYHEPGCSESDCSSTKSVDECGGVDDCKTDPQCEPQCGQAGKAGTTIEFNDNDGRIDVVIRGGNIGSFSEIIGVIGSVIGGVPNGKDRT